MTNPEERHVPDVMDELMRLRPYDRQRVDALTGQLLEEVRAYELRELRQQSHVTQVELARQLDVSQARISHIERGNLEKTQIDTLKRYVEALGGTLRIEVDLDDRTISLA
jgi:predicted transcriptional regulator